MSAFVNAFAVAPQIYHSWALAEHMGVIIGILTFGAIIIWLAYVLNSSLEMASHNENKNDDGQAQSERGKAFKSGVANMSDGSFGNDPLENKNSLKGLVLLNTPGIQIDLTRGYFGGSSHGKQDASSYDDQLKSLKNADDELSKSKAQNDQLKKELSKTEEEFKRVYGK